MLPSEITKALHDFWAKQGLNISISSVSPVGGGSINQAFCLQTSEKKYFIKYNTSAAHPNMFSSEFEGLQLMLQTKTIHIPNSEYFFEGKIYSFILLEWIEQKAYEENFWRSFAEKLAEMHKNTASKFGLHFDNYMGSLPQNNSQRDSFTDFFIENRLEPQFTLARNHGFLSSKQIRQAEKLYKELNAIFPYEKPALVHGDLWSGNFMNDQKGEAVLIDPAVYFGHREIDIAMTTMFGGFSSEFYHAYAQTFPMENGWEQRLKFYNIYPILIHINLFGASYLPSLEKILSKF